MVTKVELRVPADEMALAEAASSLGTGRIQVEETAFCQDAWSLHVWLDSTRDDAIAAALDADPSVSTYAMIEQRDARTLVGVDLQEPLSTCEVVRRCGGTVYEAYCRDGSWTLEVRFPDRDQVSRAADRFDERDVTVEFTTISGRSDVANPSPTALTDRQREILETALAHGYFEIPRELSLQELADECNISHQALSEILRRGEENLAQRHLLVGGEVSPGAPPRGDVGE